MTTEYPLSAEPFMKGLAMGLNEGVKAYAQVLQRLWLALQEFRVYAQHHYDLEYNRVTKEQQLQVLEKSCGFCSRIQALRDEFWKAHKVVYKYRRSNKGPRAPLILVDRMIDAESQVMWLSELLAEAPFIRAKDILEAEEGCRMALSNIDNVDFS